MKMSEAEIDRICSSVSRGAKLLVGRDPAGRSKIKLVSGPFGLFVKRFECSEGDIEFIRKKLAGKTPGYPGHNL